MFCFSSLMSFSASESSFTDFPFPLFGLVFDFCRSLVAFPLPLSSHWVWRVLVGGGCFILVLGMTLKLLRAWYRPMPVFCTVSVNFLPQKVTDIGAPSLVPQCVGTGGVPRPTLAGADALGFCRFSWASLARHEVPMITGSPGLGTCAKLGGCGLVGKLCMKIHSCKNVHNAVGPRGGSLLIASGKVPPLPMWIFALPPTLQKSLAIVTRKSSNFFSTIWHFYSVKVAKNLSR